jgi:hypothetical protein
MIQRTPFSGSGNALVTVLSQGSLPQDPPGRKRKATLRARDSRDRGLFWYSTYTLDFGYEALCLTRKSPKLRIALEACG